jgi:hypothetical protein
VGLTRETELGAEAFDPAREPLRKHPGDLRERALCAGKAALVGDEEAEEDRRRLLVREHHRRETGARPEPVAAAEAGLAVDRDADLVESDRVPSDRPGAHAELVRGSGSVDDGAALQQLEEREKSGGRT